MAPFTVKTNKSKKKYFNKLNRPKSSKKARLVVRNLPFSITDQEFREHFTPYGTIEEIKILKQGGGKLVGCGFVQFEKKTSAAKAIHHLNGKPLLGRPVIVDWAVPKNKFGEIVVKNTKNTESYADNKTDLTDEDVQLPSESEDVELPSESEDDDSSSSESDTEIVKQEPRTEDESKDVLDQKPIFNRDIPRPAASHDVHEGKTVFLRNVPFNCTNDELKEFFERIGPIYFAKACIDPLTEHSRGTAFVKFKNKEDALNCMGMNVDLNFKGHNMEALPALEKNNIMNVSRERHPDKKKDNRNLYLIKEGVVIAGTEAAKDVSISDMEKRLKLEVLKNNMLKKFTMFVSPTRLIVHNLPLSYNDKRLKRFFKNHSPEGTIITKAQVMLNKNKLGKDNQPITKEYGFVTFKHHEHALAALRAINNNPDHFPFNKNKRPIVSFSIEDRLAHNIKDQRVAKSQNKKDVAGTQSKTANVDATKKNDVHNKLKRRSCTEKVPSFAGIEANSKGTVKLATKKKIALQGELHSKNVKAARKEKRRKNFIRETRKEKKRDPVIKKVKIVDENDKKFNQLITKYKKSVPPTKKWYENDE